MIDPITAMMIISFASKGVGMIVGASASEEKIKAIDLQSKQSTIKHQQETLNNYDVLEKTISAQQAQATTRGVSLSSPSFEAIEMESFNNSSNIQKNLDLEESIFEKNVKIEKKNAKNSLFSSLFGDIASAGFDFAKYQASVPTSK